ncbi:hypothetical protein EA658_13895 [Pseudoxanthomonas winnipegensis]|uniref:Uncharacterized protein n=1 Tax=Pseudoxanthomonas winnipegensis TaxID=2480810 RepID=A0ABY1WB41_9GAMM|nr:hypothetical protein [Pseudoxanthomonas winnipegensis]TAA18233.1 hypothetical protein EA658_13895 [Pseudoxanthomonas winnipegensis]
MIALRRCRDCGCTDLQACPGGCHWVEPDRCSACAQKNATIDRLKRAAKRIKREQGLQHAKALDLAAQLHGFGNYVHAKRLIEQRARA